MKRTLCFAVLLLALVSLAGFVATTIAGTAEEIEDGSKKVASEIKKDAVETGKAIAETGRQVKEGTQKGWSDFKKDAATSGEAVKDSVKSVGKDIKKAFHETKEAVAKEFSGNDHNKPEEAKPEEKK